MLKKVLMFVVMAAIFIGSFSAVNLRAYASEPYVSYLYNVWGDPVPAPIPYEPKTIIRGQQLGIGSFNNPSDIVYDRKSGQIYVVDTGNNRIVVMDRSGNLVSVIKELNNGGEKDSLNQPQGIFVRDGEIYVADTQNNRIVVIDAQGNVLRELGPPETDMIDSSIPWLPKKIAVDSAGRIYVIATGINSGLVELDKNGNFRTFTGANTVSYSIWEYMLKQISTKEQKQRMTLYVPTEYSNMAMDDEDFIYVTTSTSASNTIDPVRKLNAKGNDILRRHGYVDVVGDIRSIDGTTSSLVDVAVDKYGVYSILDYKSGRIFTYDNDGNLLSAFGDIGYQMGNLQSPTALEYVEDDIYVTDNIMNSITVYTQTKYGAAIKEATYQYYLGDYQKSADYWKIVLQYNANCDLAYIGMGRIFMRNNEYRKAMEYFRYANAYEYYSDAYKHYRKEVVEKNFGPIATVITVVGIALWITKKVRSYRKRDGEELYYVG